MRKIKLIKLDTDNAKDIETFKKLWEKMKPEIEEVFIPKNVKFIGEENE